MKIQAHSLPVIANTNGGGWVAERDTTLDLEFTRRVIVPHVTEADWLVRKLTSYSQKRRTRGHYCSLTGNRMKPLNSFQFRISFWWMYSGFQWDEVIWCATFTVLMSVQGSDVNPELIWTIIRLIFWIGTIMYTMRNTEEFCHCEGGWRRECWSDLPHSRSRDDL